ncbi:S41 family peptidase [Streptomyces sp. NPDC001054]
MTQPAYLRFPHIHGEFIAFTAEDDVWIAPLDGGRAWRVSADNVPVQHPRISPDGATVAWTSKREGAPEVFVAPLEGGPARRLTYWGSNKTSVRGWTAEGDVVAITSHGQPSLRRTWAHALPLDGSASRRLPYGPIGALAHEPGGERVLLGSVSMGREAAWWKRYRGGTAGKLWLGPDAEGAWQRVHADLDGNIEDPLWVGGRIAFLSDHEGVGALYSSLPDGSDLRRHSPVEPDGFYARQAATDGTRVVWASAGRLWIIDDLEGAEPRPLDIGPGGQRADLQPFAIPASRWLSAARPDHTGRGSAVLVRGAVHWVTHRDGPARVLAGEQGVRARLPRTFRLDGEEWVAWVTDAEGEDAIEFAPATGTAPGTAPRRIARGKLGRVLSFTVAPDGERLGVASHDGRVLLVERSSGEVREVDRSENGDASGLVFSPDSTWLAWSHPGPDPLRQLKLAHVSDLAPVEATPLRFKDYSPAFTPDGKHLAFLSDRAFDPLYDAHNFDLAFIGTTRPHLITLAATTPSPFGPQRHGKPFETPDKEGTPESGDGGGPQTRIDVEGLADRIVPFPVEAGEYSSLQAAKDGVLWLSHPVSGVLGTSGAGPDDEGAKSSLLRWDFPQQRIEELSGDAQSYAVTGDGKRVLLRAGDKLRVVPSDRRAPGDDDHENNVAVDLGRVRQLIDPAAEWRQMFDEAGRLMRDNFWRPDMGGIDWDGVLDRYRPVLERVATHDDLVDLLWEVQGELGTSHAYVTPPGHGHGHLRAGLLGADISRHEDGQWHVDRVLPSETSDPHARSPLAGPGIAVRAGDTLLAVGGRPVDPLLGPGPLLAGTAGHVTELTIGPADGGEPRHVVVEPLRDEEALRYHDWVADRRAYVHEKSGGRLGYLHVPDMVGSGWAQLHRDLRVEIAKDGLVVDVRENRGGHTSQLVVEKLARRVIGWDVPRGMRPGTYPEAAPRGPVVAVANEFSGSDGDIVNAAIQALKIGPVVGTRTWGGVVGIDNRYGLVDGTSVTQPKYAFWFETVGWGVENHGVDPDVEVVVAPHQYAAGEDPQLDEAIRLALANLEETPAKRAPALPGGEAE